MNPSFSTFSPKDTMLIRNRIDIWQFPLHTEPYLAFSLLNSEEQQRAQRYHFKRDQRRFTVARSMLRTILARYLQAAPDELSFAYPNKGKPTLAPVHAIEFNLSHSGELALLAVGQDLELGIDLEFITARPFTGIANILFSDAEKKGLNQLDPRLKPLGFFHIWAQKEAFIKATGLGLSYPTEQFDVSVLPTDTYDIFDKIHHTSWRMQSFMPEIGCSAALCHYPEVEDIRYLCLSDLNEITY